MDIAPKYFISCDWGTTNFRIRLIHTDSEEIIDSYASNDGIKSLNASWQPSTIGERANLFTDFLLDKIPVIDPTGLAKNVVASGMVTSNIGLQDIPYADFPFDFGGGQLLTNLLDNTNGIEILLISGVKGSLGMMRGEETQAIGLSEYLDNESKGLLILPGTHSKHICYADGMFISSQNFMTGEVFSILKDHSILANSVINSPFEGSNIAAFREGVRTGYSTRVSSLLFTIRARDVLQNYSTQNNYYYLSGLLIGDELSFVNQDEGKICIAPPDQLYDLYKTASETLFDSSAYDVLSADILNKALLKGHKKMLLRVLKQH